MVAKATRVRPEPLAPAEEAHGMLQTVAAALIALTVVESIMILVNRSSLPSSFRLQMVKYGEWMFIPAFVWVGFVARRLGTRSLLPLLGAFATAYLFVTQFRGTWIWSGTFDHFMYSSSTWTTSWLVGIVCALAVALLFPWTKKPKVSHSNLFLVGLSLATVAAAYLPRWWPKESVFAATRPLALGGALLSLMILLVYAKGEE